MVARQATATFPVAVILRVLLEFINSPFEAESFVLYSPLSTGVPLIVQESCAAGNQSVARHWNVTCSPSVAVRFDPVIATLPFSDRHT